MRLNDFVKIVEDKTGCTHPVARKVYDYYVDIKVFKPVPFGFIVKHGAFLDTDVLELAVAEVT
jgi:hypothetical protein